MPEPRRASRQDVIRCVERMQRKGCHVAIERAGDNSWRPMAIDGRRYYGPILAIDGMLKWLWAYEQGYDDAKKQSSNKPEPAGSAGEGDRERNSGGQGPSDS